VTSRPALASERRSSDHPPYGNPGSRCRYHESQDGGVRPAADGEAQQARELMILLHTGLFVVQRDEASSADELRQFAGQILDRTRITRQ
jgi:hypothetical protein